MLKLIAKLLPHVCIILSGMMIVFYSIDRVNPAMKFIDNDITKALLCIMSIATIIIASMLIYHQRKSS